METLALLKKELVECAKSAEYKSAVVIRLNECWLNHIFSDRGVDSIDNDFIFHLPYRMVHWWAGIYRALGFISPICPQTVLSPLCNCLCAIVKLAFIMITAVKPPPRTLLRICLLMTLVTITVNHFDGKPLQKAQRGLRPPALDLDVFRFDFMFVRPRDVPLICCFNVQTEMKFHYSSSSG